MNKKSALIIALALMLTFGSFALAPVRPALAHIAWNETAVAPAWVMNIGNNYLYFNATTVNGQFWTAWETGPPTENWQVSSTFAFSIDGVVGQGNAWSPPKTYAINAAGSTVGHEYEFRFYGYIYYANDDDTWYRRRESTIRFTMPPADSQWHATTEVLPPDPLAVSIAGPATAAVGTPTSLGAVITGGVEPYEEQWTVFADRNGQDYSTTRSASYVNFLHTYLATSSYQVRVKVWDSLGAEAEDTCTINGQIQKPVMHGQLLETGAAGTMLAFGMYTDANSAEGVIPWANCVPTNDYVVTWPDVTLTAQTWYQLLTASAYPNPLLVTTRYTEANGQQWTYSFSFDTTSLTGPGAYIKSDGDSGTIEEAPPTWLSGLINWLKQMLKDVLKWAFVPTNAQMEALMPGGSLGTALLDQTTWGTGSGEWNLTVHAGAIAIPLVDISFATIASWTFVTVIKTGIQAVMCVGLIYMIVTLI